MPLKFSQSISKRGLLEAPKLLYEGLMKFEKNKANSTELLKINEVTITINELEIIIFKELSKLSKCNEVIKENWVSTVKDIKEETPNSWTKWDLPMELADELRLKIHSEKGFLIVRDSVCYIVDLSDVPKCGSFNPYGNEQMQCPTCHSPNNNCICQMEDMVVETPLADYCKALKIDNKEAIEKMVNAGYKTKEALESVFSRFSVGRFKEFGFNDFQADTLMLNLDKKESEKGIVIPLTAKYEKEFLHYPSGPDFGFPRALYVRKEYVALLEMMQTEIKRGIMRFLFLGNPGIGKTHYLYYLCYALASQGFRVVLRKEHADNVTFWLIFNGKMEKMIDYKQVEPYLTDPLTWYLVDSVSNPGEHKSIIVNVASPNVDNYKLFNKYMKLKKYYMSPWTQEEINSCATLHEFASTVVESRYKKFGGIPRLIFSDKNEEFELTIKINNSRLKDAVDAVQNIETLRESFSHTLVHIIPSQDYEAYKLRFASDYIYKKVAKSYYEKEKDNFLAYIKMCGDHSHVYGSLRGRLFEFYAHDKIAQGGQFQIRNLRKKQKVTEVDIASKPILECINFEVTPEQENFYCHPIKKTFPGIDSWDLSVGFYQMTAAKYHKIDVVVCDFLKRLELSKGSLLPFYFVVPDHLFSNFTYQSLKHLSTEAEPIKKKQKTTNKRLASEDDENIFDRMEQYVLLIPLDEKNQSLNMEY